MTFDRIQSIAIRSLWTTNNNLAIEITKYGLTFRRRSQSKVSEKARPSCPLTLRLYIIYFILSPEVGLAPVGLLGRLQSSRRLTVPRVIFFCSLKSFSSLLIHFTTEILKTHTLIFTRTLHSAMCKIILLQKDKTTLSQAYLNEDRPTFKSILTIQDRYLCANIPDKILFWYFKNKVTIFKRYHH